MSVPCRAPMGCLFGLIANLLVICIYVDLLWCTQMAAGGRAAVWPTIHGSFVGRPTRWPYLFADCWSFGDIAALLKLRPMVTCLFIQLKSKDEY